MKSCLRTKIATGRVVPETTELTKNELNALRYVAGFNPFQLKKKLTKSSHPYKDEFLLCLSQMNKAMLMMMTLLRSTLANGLVEVELIVEGCLMHVNMSP